MSKIHPSEDNTSIVVPAMSIASFIMLSMLTWGSTPLQKMFEKIEKKQTLLAKYDVCRELESSLDFYQKSMEDIFKAGCMWTTRSANIELFPEREKEIKDLFLQKSSLQYDKWETQCYKVAADYVSINELKERIASPIYHETLKCPDVYTDLNKMGITQEELDERDEAKNKK